MVQQVATSTRPNLSDGESREQCLKMPVLGFQVTGVANVAQKGAGGNPGAITTKGGDGARGSLGTGRGGGTGTGAKKAATKKDVHGGGNDGQKINGA
jgi:hypothetical protein